MNTASAASAGIAQTNKLSADLYKKLYLIRRAEEFIIKLYPQDEMKTPMHMSMGQEAIPVGFCHALGEQDQIWTSYRSHAAFLSKIGDLDAFFAELYGKVTGPACGKAGSMHLADPEKGHMLSSAIVASNIPIAVGAAFAHKTKKNQLVSCAFFGDGALDEGAFWESLNVACLMKLPVIFVCEDNGLAVHTPANLRQGYSSIVEVVRNFDCDVESRDTTDVNEIFNLSQKIIHRVRMESRPAFLHFKCFRYLEHAGIYEDFDAGYRSKNIYESWRARDCVALQRKRLIEEGIESPEEVKRIELAIDRQIEESIERAKRASFPGVNELEEGIFYEGN